MYLAQVVTNAFEDLVMSDIRVCWTCWKITYSKSYLIFRDSIKTSPPPSPFKVCIKW
jgi:hypothetical protein